jgi:endonuclease G
MQKKITKVKTNRFHLLTRLLRLFRSGLWLLRLFRSGLWLLVLVGVIGAGAYYFEKHIARPPMLYQGVPRVENVNHPDTWFRILRNQGFILGYSDIRGNPLWVEYALTQTPVNAVSLKRPGRFEPDWRALMLITHQSYTKSGYDRGHMAPNHAISLLYGRQGQMDSFLMTNICPQKPKLNQKLWQRLEEMELNNFTRLSSKVWVITGPVFSGSRERLSSDWMVEIPDAFFKAYITEARADKPSISLGFIVPQSVSGKEALSQFITSIDEIEKQTGLDFFSELDDKTEAQLEASVAPKIWNVSSNRIQHKGKSQNTMP